MASDFGDESGEKLFDWFLRMGQNMTEETMRASAEKLKSAIKNLRGNIDPQAPEQDAEPKEFARLNMAEFEELPDYESLKEIINGMLDEAAIEHDFAQVDGHDHLVFRIADAPEVDEVFAHLEESVDKCAQSAIEERDKELARERDAEPLEVKALAAKEASKAAHDAADRVQQIERVEVKSR